MKILDRYILKSYIVIFLTVFVIFMFIFILQTVWLFIGELTGKGLDYSIILKFLLYTTPKLIPLVLPLTILVSSIMTFGNFAESYEFAAMKSSGISLQRAMRSLIVFIFFLSLGTFFFANHVIPWAEFKQYNLRKNLAKLKPALAIAEGVFNDIGNINIKVEKKYGDNDQFLDKVIIHQKSSDNRNRMVIKAEKGELKSNPDDSDVLQLILTNGNRYEDIVPQSPKDRTKYPYVKTYFKEYTMNIDLREINKVDLEEEKYTTYKMLNVAGLIHSIDSLDKRFAGDKTAFGDNMLRRTGLVSLINEQDSVPPKVEKKVDTILNILEYKNQKRVLDVAIGNIKSQRAALSSKEKHFKLIAKKINHQRIYLQDKFAVAIACIILFFVGAPLGAIIRKGGIGLPMVVAICLFLAYHFIGIFGKNSAEDGSISPVLGTWLSSLIMLPLSILFTRRATSDQGIFNFDSIVEPIKKLFVKPEEAEEDEEVIITEEDLKKKDTFAQLSDDKLMAIVKNHQQFNYTEGERALAIQMLGERGISERRLKVLGTFENKKYNKIKERLTLYTKSSKRVFFYYIPFLIFSIIVPVLNNNVEMPSIIIVLLVITTILLGLMYLFNFIKSYFHLQSLTDSLKTPSDTRNNILPIVVFILGFPLYFLFYFYYKNHVKEKMNTMS